MISVDLHVFDDEKSFERSTKAIKTTEIPVFAILVTQIPRWQKSMLFIVMYYAMIGIDSYVFGDEKASRSGCKAIELTQNPLLTNFCHPGG